MLQGLAAFPGVATSRKGETPAGTAADLPSSTSGIPCRRRSLFRASGRASAFQLLRLPRPLRYVASPPLEKLCCCDAPPTSYPARLRASLQTPSPLALSSLAPRPPDRHKLRPPAMSNDKDVKLAMYPGHDDPLSSKTLLNGDRANLATSTNVTAAKISSGGFSSDAVKKIWPGATTTHPGLELNELGEAGRSCARRSSCRRAVTLARRGTVEARGSPCGRGWRRMCSAHSFTAVSGHPCGAWPSPSRTCAVVGRARCAPTRQVHPGPTESRPRGEAGCGRGTRASHVSSLPSGCR